MNLNKLNKDQLINKIKDQENTKALISVQIIKDVKNLFNALKVLFLKLSLLTIIIKYFKKYKLVRKVLFFFNWIILSLFGISIADIYNENLGLYFIDWIRSTHLYKILTELLVKVDKIEGKVDRIEVKIDETKENPSRILKQNNQVTTRYETSIQTDSGINRSNNKEEIINNYNNYNKYVILITLILIGSLSWYFWGDIKPFFFLVILKKENLI